MSPLLTWCLFGALLVAIATVLVLANMGDLDEDGDDLSDFEDDDAWYPRRRS